MSEERPRKKRWLVWGMVVSILVLLFSPFVMFRAVNRAAFERKVAELKAAGQPVSMDDLEAAYVLPEGVENAADVYQKAFRMFVGPNSEQQKLLPFSGIYEVTDEMPPYPPEVMEAVRVRLEENAECLELLDRAARMEQCLFPRQRKVGFFIHGYLQPLRKTPQLLAERNLYLAQTGQVDALFESTLTAFEVPKLLEVQPLIIDHLVGVAMQALVRSSLEDSLTLVQFTDEQLTQIQRRLGSMRPVQSYMDAIVSERACQIELFNSSPADLSSYLSLGSGWLGRVTTGGLVYSGMKDKDAVLLLECYEKELQILQLPVHEQAAEMNKLHTQISDYSLIHYLLKQMALNYRVHSINLRVEGGIRCAETALAVERYRLKYGKLPETLGTLVPEFMEAVYLDPFDGLPLRYVPQPEGGYTIYCIGEDRKDQGGKDRQEMIKITGSKATQEYDWPFTVRR
jgi:hypothetical protein